MENNIIQPSYEDINRYFNVVLAGLNGHIALRSYVESKDNVSKTPILEWYENKPGVVDKIFRFAQEANRRKMSCFCIPATTKEYGRASAADIFQMQTVLVDIDSGDTDRKLTHAISFLGTPSLVVESGGITEEDKPKLHAYWNLEKPAEGEELKNLLKVRHDLALKIGGDEHFKSAHQPIRIAGSIHHKSTPKLVKIRS